MYRKIRIGIVTTAAALAMALASYQAGAQVDRDPGDGGRRGFGGPGGPPNFDPAEFQARMMEGIKESLESTDEEWTAIEPLVSKVMEAQNALRPYENRGRGFFGFGRRGGRDGGPGGPPGGGRRGGGGFFGGNDAPEREALEEAIDSGTGIEGKLAAYRKARDEKEAALKSARGELKAVLTVKQEATLVVMGMLE